MLFPSSLCRTALFLPLLILNLLEKTREDRVCGYIIRDKYFLSQLDSETEAHHLWNAYILKTSPL